MNNGWTETIAAKDKEIAHLQAEANRNMTELCEARGEIERLTHELKVSKEIQWAEKQILIAEIEKSTALQARIKKLENKPL